MDDKPNDETKPTGRRAARKNYKLDKDSDESDSDDDASVVSIEAETIVSSKKRKRTSTSTGESKSEARIAKDASVEEEFQCPLCFKTFTSSYGLQYHTSESSDMQGGL